MSKKKSINWKAFTKMYNKLGKFRILKQNKRFLIEEKYFYGKWEQWVIPRSSIEEAIRCVFFIRAIRARDARIKHGKHIKRKIIWTHI